MIYLVGLLAPLTCTQMRGPSPPAWDYVYTPASSIEQSGDSGLVAHTNYSLHLMSYVTESTVQQGTPLCLRQAYNLPTSGGSGTIAIVDAYHFGTALNDFNMFSRQFGLPTESSTNATATTNKVFEVVYASGKQPAANASWAVEEALDIEWAHAMAPGAKIVLVEAASNSFSDLLTAVNKASQAVTAGGGKGEVSMSWGSSEFAGEQAYDSYFQTPNVVYFASSGDTGGVTNWPSTSMYVVSAGGTSLSFNSAGSLNKETGWSGSGGGLSRYEPRPSYQQGIESRVGTWRGVPDMSFDADPSSGVLVYDSTTYEGYAGWWLVGGTSLSSPSLAGVVNVAGHFSSSTFAELALVYEGLGSANFRDIVQGSAGHNVCEPGWDEVTGVGSPLGLAGK